MKKSQKLTAALELLAQSGISKTDYAPILWRILWSFGFQIPPPHLSSFLFNFLICGLWIGSFGGLILWAIRLFEGRLIDVSLFYDVGPIALIFGILMASYYAISNRKHRLPSWNSI